MKIKHENGIYSKRFSTLYFHLFTVCICLFSTDCATAWFGLDCDKPCHCENTMEECQVTNGRCMSGCAQNFTGDTCQGNALCSLADGICTQCHNGKTQ